METTKAKLLKLWNESKDEGAWSVFGGVFTVDNQKWQVVPEGKAWVDGKLVTKEPRFLKCS
jgi:predicted NUDIX family NTP pyrophosphohydrolase